ncbi:Hypothetical protein PBC10988_8420 [Planctomycetales bacterium 10988]|nr:Hypothetical protein PBC10988_8420 [Planctomycetales bacterium 10988]
MAGLLISVRNAEEAQLALSAGVDILDIKEPDRGSLGAASSETIANCVSLLQSNPMSTPIPPLSIALGELSQLPEWFLSSQLQEHDYLRGIHYVKVGLAGERENEKWPESLKSVYKRFPPTVQPVGVVYADWQTVDAPSPKTMFESAPNLGYQTLLVDTCQKDGRSLLDYWPHKELTRWVSEVKKKNYQLVLAGSLTEVTIPQVLALSPDFIAVRGAACKEGRTSQLDSQRIEQLKRQLIETFQEQT